MTHSNLILYDSIMNPRSGACQCSKLTLREKQDGEGDAEKHFTLCSFLNHSLQYAAYSDSWGTIC